MPNPFGHSKAVEEDIPDEAPAQSSNPFGKVKAEAAPAVNDDFDSLPAPGEDDFGLDLPPPVQSPALKRGPAKPEGIIENVTAGFSSGVDQTQALAGGVTMLAGDYFGSKSLKEYGFEVYNRNMAEAEKNAPRIQRIEDINNIGDFTDWFAGVTGQLAPTMLTIVGTGGIGGAIAQAGAKKLISKKVAQEIKDGVENEATKAALKKIAKAKTAGQLTGAYVGSTGIEAGSIYGETLTDERYDDSPEMKERAMQAATVGGLSAGALEVIPVIRIAKKFGFGGELSEKIAKNLSEMKMPRRILTEGIKQSGTEGFTELLQTVIEKSAQEYAIEQNLNKVLSPENMSEYWNAAASGAAGGLVFGGVSGIPSQDAPANKDDIPSDKLPDPEPQADPLNASDVLGEVTDIGQPEQEGSVSGAPEQGVGAGQDQTGVASGTQDQTGAVAGVGTPESLQEESEAEPSEPAITYMDPRLNRDIYRSRLEGMAEELVPGGGTTLIPDPDFVGGESDVRDENGRPVAPMIRTPSLNPEWFQTLMQDSYFAMPVDKVQGAVKKAVNGERLGVRQARVVDAMLNNVTGERTSGANMEYAREQLRIAREARAGAGMPDAPGWLLEEEAYPDSADGIARLMLEFKAQAENISKELSDSVDDLLYSDLSDADIIENVKKLFGEHYGRQSERSNQALEEAQRQAEIPGAGQEPVAGGITATGEQPGAGDQYAGQRELPAETELDNLPEPPAPTKPVEKETVPKIDTVESKSDRRQKKQPGRKDEKRTEERRDVAHRKSFDEMSEDEKRSAIDDLRKGRVTNPITGLPNLVAFEEDTQGSNDLILAFDMDGLGWHNDNWGHSVTDDILRQLGGKLEEKSTDDFKLYHRSGDEFAVKTSLDRDAAIKRAEEVQNFLDSTDITIEGTNKDGQKVIYTKKGLGLSFGIGENYEQADLNSLENKEQRQTTGKRSKKGTQPPGVSERIVEPGREDNQGDAKLSKKEKQSQIGKKVTAAEDITTEADKAAASPEIWTGTINGQDAEININPTNAQIESGNYQKAHIDVQGLRVSIETPAGVKRKPKWPAMAAHYGYIRDTIGADSETGAAPHEIEQVDISVNPDVEVIPDDNHIYIINQYIDGKFDEVKAQAGFTTASAASKSYMAGYNKGWKGQKSMHVLTIDEFKLWLKTGDMNAEYGVKKSPGKKPAKDKAFAQKITVLGKNNKGNTVNIDENGVRSYEYPGGGITVNQSIGIIPGGGTTKSSPKQLFEEGNAEFLTNDERVEFQKASDLAGKVDAKAQAKQDKKIADKKEREKKEDAAEAFVGDPDLLSGGELEADLFAPKTKPAAKKPAKKKRSAKKKDKISLVDRLENYFQDGRIVKSYGGQDRVIEFERTTEHNWKVTVRAVDKEGNDVQGEVERTHQTQPNEKLLKAWEKENPIVKTAPGDTYKAEAPAYGAGNKLFTSDAAAAAKKLLASKLSSMSAGIDPEIMQAGITLAGYHIEAGAREFSAYSKAMVTDLGEGIKPLLRAFYEAVRYYPGADTAGMTSAEDIASGVSDEINQDIKKKVDEKQKEVDDIVIGKFTQLHNAMSQQNGMWGEITSEVGSYYNLRMPNGNFSQTGKHLVKSILDAPPGESKPAKVTEKANIVKIKAFKREDGLYDFMVYTGRVFTEASRYKDVTGLTGEQVKSKFGIVFLNRIYNQPEKKWFEYDYDNGKVTPEADTETVSKIDTVGNVAHKLAADISKKITAGDKITWRELFAMADKAYGGTQADGAYSGKDAYDAMEMGANLAVLDMEFFDNTYNSGGNIVRAKDALNQLYDMMERLPTQTKRDEEQDNLDQYSTPHTHSFMVSWVSNLRKDDVVLEPSAGTGDLAVHAVKAGINPENIYVNELSDRRANLLKGLFDNVTQENATYLNSVLPQDIQPTVILMNPPFSADSNKVGKKDMLLGAKHVEQALMRLQEGGRLVAILGKGMAPGKSKTRDWWKKIEKKYNVRANIQVSGKEYRKFGTTFDNQFIVIDKTGATTGDIIKDEVESVRDLLPLLSEVQNDRIYPAKQSSSKPSGKKPADKVGAESGRSGDLFAPTGGDSTSQTGKRPASSGSGGRRVDGEPVTTGRTGAGNAVPSGKRTEGKSGLPSGKRDATSGISANNPAIDQHADESGVAIENADITPVEIGTSSFESYRSPIKITGAKSHPTRLSESAAMSGVKSPDVSYRPNISQKIISSGKLSDVQLESIVRAGESHKTILPNGDRKGFFIGDGTGVGKGAQVAGIIQDNFARGRTKAVWVSENQKLFDDAKRDTEWVGGDVKKLFKQGSLKGDISAKNGVVFTTYDTLRSESKAVTNAAGNEISPAKSRIDQLIDWLGEDFEGVIAFDEAHNMANALDQKGARGMKKASLKALAGVELQKRLPKARIVYVSATGATEVENLGYADRLGMWGEGTPFPSKDAFVTSIKAGGVAAMEVVAKDMKSMGVYTSRSLSYDDVEYSTIEHQLSDEQRDIYDELAGSWQVVLSNVNEALEENGAVTDSQTNGRAKSAAYSAFWGSHQRFFNQILTGMQTPSVITDIEKQLKANNSAVLQLVNTNEAVQERRMAQAADSGLSLDEIDITPRDILMQYVANGFPVNQYEEFSDDDGNIRSRPMKDSNGDFVINPESVKKRESLLDKIGVLRVPEGPLEQIINYFGSDAVAEITGRKRRLVRNKDGSVVQEKLSPSKSTQDASDFMDGKKRILIFSDAGGTGRSYHASNTAKNQQKRIHYLLQPGWRADKAVQGTGRTHRTNQAVAPHYKLVTTDIKAQRRFISTIARRLDQLGALTKGQRDTTSQGMFSADMNLEGEYGNAALDILLRDVNSGKVEDITMADFEEQTGIKVIDEETGGISEKNKPTVPKFLNRLLSMKIGVMDKMFDAFYTRLEASIEYAKQNGTYDSGMETIRADAIRKIEEKFTQDKSARYVKVELDNPAIHAEFKNLPDGSTFAYNKISGKLYAFTKAQMVTDAKTGAIVERVRRMSPGGGDYITALAHKTKYSETNKNESDIEAEWNNDLSKLSDIKTTTKHLITGTMLPIWDKLPSSQPRVIRMMTEDKEVLLGREIKSKDISGTLKSLGINVSIPKKSTGEWMDQVLSNGITLELANGWKVAARSVSGETRIELTGFSPQESDMVVSQGGFKERISYQTRLFLPSNDVSVFDRVLKNKPVVDFFEKGESKPASEKLDQVNNQDTASVPPEKPISENEKVGSKLFDDGRSSVLPSQPKPETKGYKIEPGTKPGYSQVRFDGKPSEEIRSRLKAAGYRWARGNKVWYGKTEKLPTNLSDGETGPTTLSRSKAKKKGITNKVAREAIREFRAEFDNRLNLEFRVYENKVSAFGEEQAAEYGNDSVSGAYLPKDRIVAIIASDLNDKADALETLRHEIIGHHGLNLFKPESKKEILEAVSNSRKSKILDDIWLKIDRDYAELEELQRAEEVITLISQDKQSVLTKAWAAIVAAVRKALKAIGLIDNKYTKSELNHLINTMEKRIKSGAKQETYPETNQSQFSQEPINANTFYSQMRRVLAEKLNASGNTKSYREQVDGFSRKGLFKLEELEWSGLNEWLDSMVGKKITKAEVLDFIDANQIQVEEVEKVEGDKPLLMSEVEDFKTEYSKYGDLDNDMGTDNDAGIFERFVFDNPMSVDGENVEIVYFGNDQDAYDHFSQYESEIKSIYSEKFYNDLSSVNETMMELYDRRDGYAESGRQYEKYTLPGGENYTELLLTLPMSIEQKRKGGLYKSPHYSEPNILATVRYNERTDADGKRVLFIEEVQSDWHQAGRKDGYVSDFSEAKKEYDEFVAKVQAKYKTAWFGNELNKEENKTHRRLIDASGIHKNIVPDAPFKTTWPMLAMKRMIRHASENGFDRIAWTTGDQQNERYSLEKHIDNIGYIRRGDLVNITVWGKGGNQLLHNQSADRAYIEENAGKEIADKIYNGEGRKDGDITYLEDIDLKVGGQGMRGFYDNMLPKMVNKYVKKWGGKVGETDINEAEIDAGVFYGSTNVDNNVNHIWKEIDGENWTLDEDGTFKEEAEFYQAKEFTDKQLDEYFDGISVHSLDITPKMKDAAMEGQPMFSKTKGPDEDIDTRKTPGRKYTKEQNDAIEKGGFGERKELANNPLKAALGKALNKLDESKQVWKTILRQGFLDQYDSFRTIINDKRAWMMANLSHASGGAVEAALEYGQPFINDGAVDIDIDKKSLSQIFEPLGEEVNDWLMWVAGNRAERLASEDRERLFSDVNIQALKSLNSGKMDDGRSRSDVYESVRNDFEEMNDAFVKIGVKTGVISHDEASVWRKQGFYVPFYRLAEEESKKGVTGPYSGGGLVKQTAYKKLKGADIPLGDLLTNVVMNWNHIVSAGLKNQAAIEALSTAEEMGLATQVQEKDKSSDAVFIRLSGKKMWLELDSSKEGQLVLESLMSLNYEGMNNFMMKTARKFKRLLTYGVTASPEFKAANLFRDTIQAIAVADMSTNIAKNLANGFRATKKGSKTIARMVAGGGAFGDSGYIHGSDPEALQRLIKKDIDRLTILDSPNRISKMWDAYQDFGARLENVNRAANFEQDLSRGDIGLLEANFNARDHLDFQRTGAFTSIRILAQVVPFLNARMQGLSKLGRSAFDKNQQKQFAAVVGTYAMASVLLYLYMSDDDDYDEAPQWERDAYHLFKIPGSDVMYRLPRPFEVGFIATIAERATEQMVDDDVHGKLFLERLWHGLNETLSFNPVPQMVMPAFEVWANKNVFTGRQIESESMKNLSPSERRRAWTSETAIGISKGFNSVLWDDVVLSPLQIEHLVNGYFGWIGGTVLESTDMIIRGAGLAPSIPERRVQDYVLAGRFARTGPTRGTKYTTEFYENMKDANRAYANIRFYREMGDSEKAMELAEKNQDKLAMRGVYTGAQRAISKINKQIMMIRMRNIPSSEKLEEIDDLNEMKNAITKQVIEKSNAYIGDMK